MSCRCHSAIIRNLERRKKITEINNLPTTLKQKACADLSEPSDKFIEFKVCNLLRQIVKGAIIDDFEKQVIDGKVFEVTVENAGGNNENG